MRDSKYLVLNALRRETHISHFTLDEAISLSQELDVDQTFLTHISHQMGSHEDVSKELPSGIKLAYDMLSIAI